MAFGDTSARAKLRASVGGNDASTSVLAVDGAARVQQAAAQAQQAQRSWWESSTFAERLVVVRGFAARLESEEGAAVAQVLCSETGKPLRQARAEVRLAAARARQACGLLQQLPYALATAGGRDVTRPAAEADGGAVVSSSPGQSARRRTEFVEWEPVGVVASISAWNFPVVLACDVAVPALCLGNAVLAKPSEHAVLTGVALEGLWRRAGLPEVGTVLFTGSRVAGRAVAACAAGAPAATPAGGGEGGGSGEGGGREVPVPVHLELGGKDAVYVHSDAAAAAGAAEGAGAARVAPAARGADLRTVAHAVADAAFANSGQVCCAPKVVYVAGSQAAADDFARLAAARVARLRAGDPALPSTELGPLALGPAAAAGLRALVQEAVAGGAKDWVPEQVADPATAAAATWGAAAEESGGSFMPPAVLTHLRPGMRVLEEETFGPVLCVVAVSGPEEAAALMSRSRYGLTAACYSRDEGVARRLLRAADVGTVFWNGCGEMPLAMPWSGRRWSGLGFQLGGPEGYKAFLRPRSHVFNRLFS
ncbi:hypothetical protein HYH02_007717 [Chlamydomonas schloesseri]|uniref:Aldehyde dehydrogenase domain-containing protein n=1 Tax=Chlamydomonas schloesseri TaxID=2026947 RepID=A0A835WGX0_9CHLO|nr:hypothetical protein HYH02_007717 [Chlamydomonas schloesseri]|eukprot:KAG2447389.1 hypothetical protein HYH02_007717 [Chlamydomonas schloesseri]